jgi:argonaute-like protein implicated in RNA metabolism and viral defense
LHRCALRRPRQPAKPCGIIVLHLRPHGCETSLPDLAAEVLALTKMNWNSTQFDQRLPIPIHAARQVGRVLKHVSYGEREQSDYPFYM